MVKSAKMLALPSVALLAGVHLLGTAWSAQADCRGVNTREVTSVEYMSGGETVETRIDSCRQQQLIDAYGQVKDAAGLAGLLGAAYWPVGVSGGVFYGWAWANQNAVRDCMGDEGIMFTQINGIITTCTF